MGGLINASDLYGQRSSDFVGTVSKKTTSVASGKVASEDRDRNHAFPLIAFVLALVMVRVFESMLPEG